MNDLNRYKELKEVIWYHNDRYYNQDNPEISDYEYDMLMQELKALEIKHPEYISDDSPTQKVGGEAKREAGVLVKHNVPMLSLQDVFSKEEVEEFIKDMKEQLDDPVFVVEYKIDGLSLALRYVNSKLDVAITRGDGILEGEDVTVNAKVIKDVKKTLKDPIEYLIKLMKCRRLKEKSFLQIQGIVLQEHYDNWIVKLLKKEIYPCLFLTSRMFEVKNLIVIVKVMNI